MWGTSTRLLILSSLCFFGELNVILSMTFIFEKIYVSLFSTFAYFCIEPKGKAVSPASTAAPEPSLKSGQLVKANNGGESPQVQSGQSGPAKGTPMTDA